MKPFVRAVLGWVSCGLMTPAGAAERDFFDALGLTPAAVADWTRADTTSQEKDPKNILVEYSAICDMKI